MHLTLAQLFQYVVFPPLHFFLYLNMFKVFSLQDAWSLVHKNPYNIINSKKNPFPYSPKDWILLLSKISYGFNYNQMHAMNMAKHRCKNYLSIKENWHQLHFLMHSFLFLFYKEVQFKHFILLGLKESKWYLYNVHFFIDLAWHHFIYWHKKNSVQLKWCKYKKNPKFSFLVL